MRKPLQQLIMFARFPRLGRVKTRMTSSNHSSPPLQPHQSLELYRAFLADLIPRFCNQSDFDFLILLGGAAEGEKQEFEHTYQLSTQQVQLMPQHSNNLGVLMEWAFTESFGQGYQKAIVIGSDAPQLVSDDIRAAFSELQKNDVVLGPDHGGGMYLVGYSGAWGLMQQGIAWSQGTDCQALLSRCFDSGRTVTLLEQQMDLDTVNDLQQWYKAFAHHSKNDPFSENYSSTFQTLEELL